MVDSIGSNTPGPSNYPTGEPQDTGVSGADVYETLSRLEQFVSGQLAMISGLDPATDADGNSAIALPALIPLAETGGVSTADLLQLIRAESRKTTEALLATTMESIKLLKAQIKQYSDDSMAQLEEAAKSQEKARNLMKVMNVVKWADLAVGAVVSVAAIIGSGGVATPLALAIFSACMLIGTTCLSEIKGKDGESPMDKMMKDLGKAMEKFASSYGDMPAWAKDAIAGTVLVATVALACLAPSTLALTLPLLAIAVVGALPDKAMSDEMKGQIMASIVMLGAMLLLSAAAAGAAGSMAARGTSAVVTNQTETSAQRMVKVVEEQVDEALTKAGSAVAQETETGLQSGVKGLTSKVDEGLDETNAALNNPAKSGLASAEKSPLEKLGDDLARYGTMFKASLDMVKSGGDILIAVQQYNADMANANVQALKELLKMQQTLVDSDANFVQMLADIQAQLDSGCAEIVAAEHQTQENINREMFS